MQGNHLQSGFALAPRHPNSRSLDKRSSSRNQCSLSITYKIFSNHAPYDEYEGKINNYSDFGFGAILNQHLTVGTVILYQTAPTLFEHFFVRFKSGFRSTALAEVKWTQPIGSCEETTHFATGFRYLTII